MWPCRRAAALGQAALRHGFAGLGGMSEHIRALREHVALPLKARLSCLLLDGSTFFHKTGCSSEIQRIVVINFVLLGRQPVW